MSTLPSDLDLLNMLAKIATDRTRDFEELGTKVHRIGNKNAVPVNLDQTHELIKQLKIALTDSLIRLHTSKGKS